MRERIHFGILQGLQGVGVCCFPFRSTYVSMVKFGAYVWVDI